jgi:uncharacterized repeat protein (TIGR01451 family)
VLLFSQNVFADTAANTRITNSVEVTYSDAFGLNETTSAPVSVTVTVVLLPASPTLSIITSDIDPAHEDSDNTLTYSISSNANGEDSYAIAASEIGFPTVFDNASFLITPPGSISLGATTLASAVSSGSTITVPWDGSSPDGSVNGIAVTEQIIIGGQGPYPVTAITHSGDTTSITFTGTITTAVPVGAIVGEYAEFDIIVHTGTLTSPNVYGTYTIQATATYQDIDGNDVVVPQGASDSSITVRLFSLGISKYVRNVDNGNGDGTGATYTYNSETYYSAGVEGVPGNRLEYIIVVENPAGASLATNVKIVDSIPQFTTCDPNSLGMDPDGNGSQSSIPINQDPAGGDPGEYENTPGSETVYIYAGTGGNDGAGAYGDGNGGTLAAGVTTIGLFQVTID